jgi:glycerate kinase
MTRKVVIATDKWRGSFTSKQAGAAMAGGVRRAFPDAEVQVIPLADGGEGTLDVLEPALGGTRHTAEVCDALGQPVSAAWLELADGRAVVESALPLGWAPLPASRRDPLSAGSRGLGRLLLHVLDAGVRDLILTLGGTATMDGGAGMAAALGYRLEDAAGDELPDGGGALAGLARIEPSGCDRRLEKAKVEVWCDVASVLLGPRGAARVYGPQKGADGEHVELLETGLRCLARRISRDLGQEVADLPGAGAAGGLGGGAAAFLGGQLVSGSGRVLDAVGFDEALDGAHLVLTGEGCFDPDAMPGKLPDAVLARAAAREVAAAVVCGDVITTDGDIPGVRVFSRRDLIDNRGWALGAGELESLAELAARTVLG